MKRRMNNIVKQFRKAYRFPSSPVANEKRLVRRVAEEWRHEYPPGTPVEFIVDEVLLCWSRNK
jgi:hypothetical protein